jgi:hypothetical protein
MSSFRMISLLFTGWLSTDNWTLNLTVNYCWLLVRTTAQKTYPLPSNGCKRTT